MSAAGPSQGANPAPAGGSAAAQPQAWGDDTSFEQAAAMYARAAFSFAGVGAER